MKQLAQLEVVVCNKCNNINGYGLHLQESSQGMTSSQKENQLIVVFKVMTSRQLFD